MKDEKAALVALLASEAYSEGDVALSSGARSSFYIDGKLATYSPRAANRIGHAIWQMIRAEDVVGVGGLTLGADAIAISTMFAALENGVALPAFSVRKDPKPHGKHKLIEGVMPPAGSRVAIVDDVVTSGNSVLKAVEAVREQGLEVAIVVPLVDREEGARRRIEEQGLRFHPFCTVSEIRAAFRDKHAHANA